MIIRNGNGLSSDRVVQNGEYWECDLIAAFFEFLRWRLNDEIREGL